MDARIFETTRLLPFTPSEVYGAFAHPAQLALWFGPSGFSNTFEVFEFKTDGRWIFTMHGPDGQDYKNENIFRELIPNEKIVFEHIFEPVFTLTITLKPTTEGTQVHWLQVLENETIANQIRHIIPNANEQNLDRWHSVLSSTHHPSDTY